MCAAAVLLCGAAVVALPSPTARAAVASGGVVVTINGDRFYVTNAELNAHREPDAETTLSPGNHEPRGGTSALELVQLAGLGPDALQDVDDAMTVSRGSESITLSADEVRDGFDGDPLGSPRFATFDGEYNANQVRFLRPLRPSESSAQQIDPLPNTNIQVALKTNGERLAVGLIASARRIDPGQSVTFHVDPQPAGAATYQWDFEGSGEPVNGSQPANAHVYAVKGHFEARVTVTTANGSSGTASVFIDVGRLTSGNTSNTPGPNGGLGGGGAAGGGGTAESGGGDDHEGPSTGPAHAKKSDTTKNRAGSASQGGSGGTGGGASNGDAASRGADGARSSRTRAAPATHGPGISVSGILLADQSAFTGAVPALTGSSESALTRSAARAAAGSPGGLLAWVAGGALGIGVLLSGALLEVRLLARRTLRSA